MGKAMTRLIAIDADDTLWDCQSHFDNVERRYFDLLAPYGTPDFIHAQLFETEKRNMATLGFGSKAFTLSLIENALRVSGGDISSARIAEIISLGKSLLQMPTPPLPGVAETLSLLRDMARGVRAPYIYKGVRMIVFTKGEIIEQENKLMRSGLAGYFDDVHIVADKTQESFLRLCRLYNVVPQELLMIGNSFKSDIAPALAIGANAIYIPFHNTWKMEYSEEFEHANLIKVSRFSDIIGYFC